MPLWITSILASFNEKSLTTSSPDDSEGTTIFFNFFATFIWVGINECHLFMRSFKKKSFVLFSWNFKSFVIGWWIVVTKGSFCWREISSLHKLWLSWITSNWSALSSINFFSLGPKVCGSGKPPVFALIHSFKLFKDNNFENFTSRNLFFLKTSQGWVF